MECSDVREYLLSADNAAQVPTEVQSHIQTCKTCRSDFNLLESAARSLRADAEAIADDELTKKIMSAVKSEAESPQIVVADPPTRFRSWLIAGALIILGVFGLRFSEGMVWLRQSFGPGLDVAMSLILGIFLTAYICILVGSNLPLVRRVLRLRQP